MAAATEQSSTFSLGRLSPNQPMGSSESAIAASARSVVSSDSSSNVYETSKTSCSLTETSSVSSITSSPTPSFKRPAHLLGHGQRRASFSMTLPPSRAKDAAATTVAKTIVFDDVLDHRQVVFQRDACGMYQEGQPQQRTQQTKQTPQRPHGDPPVQRRSVQFVPGDEDELRDHEHQRTLPKTPYPITENPMDSSSTPPSSSPSRKTSSPSTHDTSARRSPSASPLHLPHPPTDGMCHQFSVSPPHSLSSTSSASLKGMPTSGLDKDTLNMAFEKLVNT